MAEDANLEQQLIEGIGISDNLLNEINSISIDAKSEEEKSSAESGSNKTALEAINSGVKITVKDNKTEAIICVYSPHFGGKDVTLEDIKKEIQLEKITFGIDEELLENIVNEKLYDSIFTFARGVEPVAGQDGYINSHFEQTRKLQPKLLADGKVDYRDLGVVVNIHRGDVICDIFEATEGSSGKSIFGEIIPAKPGKECVIPQGDNTGISGDKAKLIALEDGNLVYERGKFNVQTTFTIKDGVDISTGNINFIGDVVIKGSVDEGFSVISGKSIIVNGMVNGALIKAEEDIVVKNGAINSKLLTSHGSVSMGFGENTTVHCKGDVKSGSFVSCFVEAEGDLYATANPGTLVGGIYKVMGNMFCNVIGHRNYIATTISIGNFATLTEEKEKLEDEVNALNSDINKINLSLDYLQQLRKEHKLEKEKEEFANAAVRLKVQKTLSKKPLQKRILEIERITNQSEAVTIKVNRFLHPNVKINFGRFSMVITKENGKCVVSLDEDGIKII